MQNNENIDDDIKKEPGSEDPRLKGTVSKADFEALLEKVSKMEAERAEKPLDAETRPVIIAQPVSETEAEEATRFASQKKIESAANSWLEEKIPIKLFKDGKNYKDDLTVSVNGETIRIMRGVPVKIKRKFAMLIEDSELQTVTASEFDQFEREKFKNAVADNAL